MGVRCGCGVFGGVFVWILCLLDWVCFVFGEYCCLVFVYVYDCVFLVSGDGECFFGFCVVGGVVVIVVVMVDEYCEIGVGFVVGEVEYCYVVVGVVVGEEWLLFDLILDLYGFFGVVVEEG